jgi:hypothetical protein
LLFAVGIGAAYSEAPPGSKGSPWASALIGLAFTALAVRLFAVQVRAGDDGLLVRNPWRTRRIAWREVVEVQVVALSSWRAVRLLLFSRQPVGLTLHRRDGDEVLLDATVRRRWRDAGPTYGPPFDGWLAALEDRRRASARWN